MRDWPTCSLTEATISHIWGQSKNTSELAGSAGLLLSIFTLTPNIPKYPNNNNGRMHYGQC